MVLGKKISIFILVEYYRYNKDYILSKLNKLKYYSKNNVSFHFNFICLNDSSFNYIDKVFKDFDFKIKKYSLENNFLKNKELMFDIFSENYNEIIKDKPEYSFFLNSNFNFENDFIEQLLNTNKNIVSGVTFLRDNIELLNIGKKDIIRKQNLKNYNFENLNYDFIFKNIDNDLIKIDYTNFDCLLVHSSYFDILNFKNRFSKKYYSKDDNIYYYFSKLLYYNKIDLFANINVLPKKDIMKLNSEVEKLIFRKKSIEYQNDVLKKDIISLNELIKLTNNYLCSHKMMKLINKIKFELEVKDLSIKMKEKMIILKNNMLEYKHFIYPKIIELNKNDNIEISKFEDLEKKFKKIIELKEFKELKSKPENIELLNNLKDIEDYNNTIRKLIELTSNELNNTNDNYKKFKLKKELLELNSKLCINLRFFNKFNKAYNSFLIEYEKDMEDYKLNFNNYLEKAKIISEKGLDIRLTFAINDYENKYKNNKDYEWLFFTTIRKCVNETINNLNKDNSVKKIENFNEILKPN